MISSGWSSALDPAGPQAQLESWLFWIFVVVCGAIYFAVLLFLGLALFRSRRPHTDPEAHRGIRLWVAGAVAATVAVLVAFVTVSFIGTEPSFPPGGGDELRIEVYGQQWWWEVRYPGNRPDETFSTANEIHVPVGVPVRVALTSLDVIHSFWVPSLRGKMDLVPSRHHSIRLQADLPGVYRGQCAEFCGMQHARMAFYVVAREPAEFESWLAAQRSPAREPESELERRGREVFLDSPCVLCHSIRGTSAFGTVGPDLTHVGSRLALGAGTLPNSLGHLGGWIADSQRVKPGNRMPPMALGSEELEPLIAYLESLR